jgi:integrase
MRIPQPFFRKAKNAWYVQFGEKQLSLGKDEAAAKAKYAALLRDRGMGDKAPTSCTAVELIDAYLDWVKTHREAATYDGRCKLLDPTRVKCDGWRNRRRTRTGLREFVSPTLPAEQLTATVVAAWLKARQVHSPSTTHQYISIISIMFNWGRRMGYVTTNPLANMEKPTPRVREDFIPPEQFEPFLAAIKNDAMRDYVKFALNTGARANEIRNLEAAYLNRKTRRFVLPLGKSKGRQRRRIIYLNATAFALVERLAAKYPTGKLFRNSFGRPWSGGSVAQAMIPLKEILGMPGFCATVLRHSFAHWQLTEGVDATTVAKLMGHVDTTMLNTRYGHLEESAHLDVAANKFQVGGLTPVGSDASDLARKLSASHGRSAYVEALNQMSNAVQMDDLPLARAFRDAANIIQANETANQLSIVG